MKKISTVLLAVILSSLITFVLTAYLTNARTYNSLTAAVRQMEALNAIGRVETWDRVEQYLVHGCDTEALEFVRQRQISELSFLNYYLQKDDELIKKVEARNEAITKRAIAAVQDDAHAIPNCMPLTEHDEPPPLNG